MFETETLDCPENYFHVDIAGLAQFVICASDETFADLRLREYCKDNDFLKIDPDAHFDIFNSITKIPDTETVQYRKAQFAHDVVRLVGFKELNIETLNRQIPIDLSIYSPNQLQLVI